VQLHHEANADDRAAGRTHGLVRGLVNEANARISAGDMDGAAACAAEGAELAESLGDLVAIASLQAVHGHVAVARGDPSRAVELFGAALADLGAGEVDALLCRLDMADALLRSGGVAEARTLAESVVAASSQRGVPWLLAQPTLAGVLRASGAAEDAARVIARTEREYAERGFAWQLAIDRLAIAREAPLAPTHTGP
jgi:ATP/maltotriose-dependent transcriptional regulator MalT